MKARIAAAGAFVLAVALVAIAVDRQRLVQRTRLIGNKDSIQYVYMPASMAKETEKRSAMLNSLLTQSLRDALGDGLGINKSCAISSLVAQANFIFPHWDGCGYIHHANTKQKGAVSGPAHDMFCGPNEM